MARRTTNLPAPAYVSDQSDVLRAAPHVYGPIGDSTQKRKLMCEFVIPPRSGRAWELPAGHVCRLLTFEGPQVLDLNLWNRDDPTRIRPDLVRRVLARLNALNEAQQPDELNVSGFNFHRLQGKPVRYTIHVNGPWCITFEWDGEDAVRVDLEQYH